MLNIPRSVLPPMEFVPVLYGRFAARLSGCLLLTGFNVVVIVICARALFQVSAHNPVWLAGVSVLFAGLLGSLLRVWYLLIFRSRNW